MRVTIRMFAAARDAGGFDAQTLELPPGANVADALASLRQRLMPAQSILKTCAFAINQRFARPDEPLADGDELAILPPVSGG